MNDDWLDAFSLDDFEDSDLAGVDAAVDRLAPRRPRSRRWPVVAAVAVALAAAFALWLGRPVEPVPQTPTQPDLTLQIPERPALPDPEPPPPPPKIVRVPRPAPAPLRLPGLTPGTGAELRIDGDRAILVQGQVTYRHDDTHDPGVNAIAAADLPVTFAPVGTQFVVEARAGVSMVGVLEGTVEVVHDEGAVLATLVGPADAIVLDDDADPTGVKVVVATEITLDGLLEQAPMGCRCTRPDVVATIARLRLATRTLRTLP